VHCRDITLLSAQYTRFDQQALVSAAIFNQDGRKIFQEGEARRVSAKGKRAEQAFSFTASRAARGPQTNEKVLSANNPD
jgi:hypothetical protein